MSVGTAVVGEAEDCPPGGWVACADVAVGVWGDGARLGVGELVVMPDEDFVGDGVVTFACEVSSGVTGAEEGALGVGTLVVAELDT